MATAITEVSNPFNKMGMIVAGGGGRTDDLKIALAPKEDAEINSGDLCSVDPSDGLVKQGLHASNSMPLWSVNEISDNAYDVINTTYGFAAGSPGTFGNNGITDDMTQYSRMNFVVGSRGYEMFTTSYNSDQDYNPDDLLMGRLSDHDDAGEVYKVTSLDDTEQIVGQVSRGTVEMDNRQWEDLPDVLFYWTLADKARSPSVSL